MIGQGRCHSQQCVDRVVFLNRSRGSLCLLDEQKGPCSNHGPDSGTHLRRRSVTLAADHVKRMFRISTNAIMGL